jgi:magnesium chelatase accessory protein
MLDRPEWSSHGADWPHRELSTFVEAGSLRWHVQRGGAGPELLLLHGTGASSHSWAGLLPLLAESFTVTAPDLPGHGFTSSPGSAGGLAPRGVVASLEALMQRLSIRPVLIVGHSVGAALAAHLALDRRVEPAGLVGITPSLVPPSGFVTDIASELLGPAFRSALMARLLASRMREGTLLRAMLKSTGSAVPPRSIQLYQRLLGFPGVLSSVLTLVSQWEPRELARRLPSLETPFLLVAGVEDRWIPLSSVRSVASTIPSARLVEVPGVGHVAHEEEPDRMALLIRRFAEELGILRPVPR